MSEVKGAQGNKELLRCAWLSDKDKAIIKQISPHWDFKHASFLYRIKSNLKV